MSRSHQPNQQSQTKYCDNTYDNTQYQTNIKNISSIDPNRYTSKLENDGKLLRPKADYNQKFRTIWQKYGASICCCVLPNTMIMPYYNFESTHFIYFQYKRHQLKQRQYKKHRKSSNSFRPNNYVTQKRYAYYLLRITYKQLIAIDKFIKNNNGNNKFFAESYPKPLPDTMRKRGDLQQTYEYEEQLLIKPTLPSGPSKVLFGKKKSMTHNDLKQYASYLHCIFASPFLLLEDEIYEILDIQDPEIRTLFKTLALNKLETLISEATKYDHIRCLRDPTRLKKKIGINFHTLWIVKRPLNDEKAAFLGCDHWALKFEGNDQLMTIGFFAFNKDHGIILTKIVPNTPLNRRLFWYYWPRDNIPSIESQHFNERWTVLEKLYLREMSCELVGILIEEWLSYDNHAVYELTHNNCQHFARDFVAPLDIKIAKRLSSSFDVKVVKSLIPAGVLAEGIDAEAKCNNIHSRLWPILSNYKLKATQRKQEEEKIDEQEQFKKNWDFLAKEFGISMSSSSEDEEDKQSQIEEEMEKKAEEQMGDIQDSLTIYKTNIGHDGNECYDDDEDEMDELNGNKKNNKHTDIDKMTLTVSMSSADSVERKNMNNTEEKDQDNDVK